jgi:formin 2
VSSLGEECYWNNLVMKQDLKILATSFCSHLLAAGVVRQINDPNAPLDNMFRVSLNLATGFLI